MNPYYSEDVNEKNEKSLQSLVRAIRLSQGEFSLILVRCNYADLRDRMRQRLRQISPVQIKEITLTASAKTLYSTILAELEDENPSALMVFGLESVTEINKVLTSSKYVREEFRKNFPFPLLLWVNDQVLQKLNRLATDFANWATRIEFTLTTDELLDFLHQKTDEIFVNDANLNPKTCYELETARKNLQNCGQLLKPAVEASIEFVIGLNYYIQDQIDSALEHYQPSLTFWQRSHHLERQGILLLHIALAYYRKGEKNHLENQRYWQESRYYLQQCIDIFEQAQCPDLVTQNISKLGEVLRRLQEWGELKILAERSLALHQTHGSLLQLAQDYGFLAEVALEQSRWNEAKQLAQQALQTLAKASNVQTYAVGLYLFILACSQQPLGNIEEAVSNLEKAREEGHPQYEPQLYINILEKLRYFYFEKGQYLEAFRIKQEKLQIEHQYGFRAFIGAAYLNPQRKVSSALVQEVEKQRTVAQEITASGRQQDVNQLIERISGTEHKLTVIHGQSGVGKSSILQAGLIPALQQQPIGERDTLPILLRVYTNWIRILGKCLVDIFNKAKGKQLLVSLDSIEAIIEQLRKNADDNLLTVLIFDQFEEFFFVYKNKVERQKFYEFLCVSLDIPFVKIILCLREDYLHYLLECERMVNFTTINNNILDKNIRYSLVNFSPKQAKEVVQTLTQKTQFYLEPALIDKLVQDLAGEIKEVRPIELQIVGSQLQTDKIVNLEKYLQLGNKEKLVERFLEEVITDCGYENELAARLVLFLLTDENGIRPLKTRTELRADLSTEANKLDFVLEILVMSGIVLLLPEVPVERYQLIHDYLVTFIRQQQASKVLTELEAAKEKQKLIEEQLRQAQREKEIADIEALLSLSQALWLSCDHLGALIASIKAAKKLQKTEVPIDIKIRTVGRLCHLIYGVQEYNRLQGHKAEVNNVSFSPNGQMIASASDDYTVKLWHLDGTELQTIQGHSDWVSSVSFSPNSQMIASASNDRTVKLWRLDGTQLQTLQGHTNGVNSVSFSPDGQMIASASSDGTVKLWRPNGTQLQTLQGHSREVNSVSFSPDGQMIASASNDGTVKLWHPDGTQVQTLHGHSRGVNSVSFSPDGQMIASASYDCTVKLWRLDGTELQTLQGHIRCGFYRVSFSPDGQTIASASNNGTVVLWKFNLEDLLVLGCNWLHNYLKSNPNVNESDRTLYDEINIQK